MSTIELIENMSSKALREIIARSPWSHRATLARNELYARKSKVAS